MKVLPLSVVALRVQELLPEDLLDATQTIPQGQIMTCQWLEDWIPSTTFLDWAARGLHEGDDYGCSNAIVYSKRAAASRIDALILYNHLSPFVGVNYHQKVEALREIGITVPTVVHDLVFNPRNEAEHEYKVQGQRTAQHALEIARLFVQATDPEFKRGSILAVNWNVSTTRLSQPSGETVDTQVWGDSPMLFIDIIDQPPAAKIVDPSAGEIRSTPLNTFTRQQAIRLASILRANYSRPSLHSRSFGGVYWIKQIKQQGRF